MPPKINPIENDKEEHDFWDFTVAELNHNDKGLNQDVIDENDPNFNQYVSLAIARILLNTKYVGCVNCEIPIVYKTDYFAGFYSFEIEIRFENFNSSVYNES